LVVVQIAQADLNNAVWNLQAEAVVPGTSGASVWSVGWKIPNDLTNSVQHPLVALYGPTP
jgi:hypothetical protein